MTTAHHASLRHVVDEADAARLALARLECAAGAGALDRGTIIEIIGRMESGGHSLVGLLRRLVHDLGADDNSSEAPHLLAAAEHARQLTASLQQLGAVIERPQATR
ncbi:hypothetical protein ACRAWC_10630 [Leifsonia sp. L25]|uniref:hypothetical protein n=1 Tax=Actinomycetes TaxID=1760 RepID=UPI003D6918C7